MLTAREIQNYTLFAGLDEPDLVKISRFCSRKVYPANSVIFDPESTTPDIYLLEGGNDAVQIEIPADKGKPRIVIHTLSKGETFGWVPLCPAGIRTATARAIDEATVIQVYGPDLLRLIDQNIRMGYLIMRNLSCIINLRLEYTTIVLRHEHQRWT
jgi:CRP-like cAMP-binding protein